MGVRPPRPEPTLTQAQTLAAWSLGDNPLTLVTLTFKQNQRPGPILARAPIVFFLFDLILYVTSTIFQI